MTVEWAVDALADISQIVNHIAEENPFAAKRVSRDIFLAGESLAMLAHRGRPGRIPGTRELVPVFPYIIVDENDTTTILPVWHGAQNR